jgi:hypothetical protein
VETFRPRANKDLNTRSEARSTAQLAAPAIPLPVSIMWTSAAAVFDLVIAGAVQRDVGMFRSGTGTRLPLAIIFVTTWATGIIVSMMPERPSRC